MKQNVLLSLVTLFVLNSKSSDIYMATPGFLWLLFAPHSLLLFGKVEDVPGEGNPNGYELVTSCFVQYACKSSTMKALAAMALGLHWSGIMVMLYEVMLWLLLRLLHQP